MSTKKTILVVASAALFFSMVLTEAIHPGGHEHEHSHSAQSDSKHNQTSLAIKKLATSIQNKPDTLTFKINE